MRRLGHLAVAATLLAGAAASGCSADDSGPDPREAAETLAGALAAGDLAEVAFDDPAEEPQAAYDEVVAGLATGEDGPAPDVEVGEVREGEDGSATAALTWTWPVLGPAEDAGEDPGEDPADGAWTYQTEARLTEVDGAWQVAWDRALVEPSLAEDEVLDRTTIAAARGEVTGARGKALVTDRPVITYGVDRARVPRQRAVADARALARLVDIDPAAYAERVRAAGDKAFVEALTYRREDVPAGLVAAIGPLRGVIAIPGERALAPTREFAAPVLGSVGEVTAEMVEEDPTLRPGDRAGLSGLQARYEDQLRGEPGVVVDALGPGGEERELFRVEATPGEELALTLDVDLQLAAEQVLADTGPASALVAVRPSDGALLAVANGAGTDGYNLATYGQLAPGSTFKVVSALALLRAGLRPTSPVACTPTSTVDGKRFTNYSDYPASALGRVPLRTAVAQSCNTAFIAERDRLERAGEGADDLAAAAASLGLGVDHDLGFPAYFGSVSPPTSETQAAADLIGQGTVLASPMAVATVLASVQRGATVVPRLLEQVDVAAPAGVEPLAAGEADALRGMLRAVVTEGSGRALADVPGPPVLAKTGTAEFEDDGRLATHAWMAAAQGDLAVAVFVERGASGSRTAGPLLESFLRTARRLGG
ncbi:penicillin-binding transpeptidase domain-containing protein [Nocardioides marmotae]|uniref:penicillin-binding transpeptidase domain-containing protein n=1 Tax=Nocardioides marmotae TaxID=2663857 RepID=UPI0012B50CF7|nr:penicillin-binding transpeptidase domain-containing protein [Nocardioides marmotae]MBC9732466.1 penicillin-binding protein [Nocardioides marmotae]MTB83585.1 penicillin-binding protein [Nocardioides marmotae]